jgi:hypothetical protein
MGDADAGAGPDNGEALVVGEEHVVDAGARHQPTDDVRHAVVHFVPEDGRAVVARDADRIGDRRGTRPENYYKCISWLRNVRKF